VFWRLQSSLRWSSGLIAKAMTPLILKPAPTGWNQEDYEVLEDGVVIGRVFLMPIGLKGRPWMWAIRERKGRTPAHGYEPTREAAMAAFAKSWRK
jgi:hypothetical protein